MDVLVYKAVYRMDNVYAEGYIILNDGFTEGVFANDYMAIYMENGDKIVAELRSLTINTLLHFRNITYTAYHFYMSGNILTPGKTHAFFSNINQDYLYLDISEEVVDEEYSLYLAETLLPKVREISLQ